jgi:hypothetical protein
MIMHPNGVTHLLAETHMDTVLQALMYVEACRFTASFQLLT